MSTTTVVADLLALAVTPDPLSWVTSVAWDQTPVLDPTAPVRCENTF